MKDLVGLVERSALLAAAFEESGLAVRLALRENIVLLLGDQFFDFPAGQFGRGGIDEGGAALQVEAIDAFTGGIKNVFVTALEFLQFLGAGLDVQFENVL